VAGAAAGDPIALGRLLEMVAPGVLRVVRAVLGPSHPDVRDVAQESLIALREALARFRGESTVAHFAGRVALRVALSARRRTQRREKIDERDGPPPWVALDASSAGDDPGLRAARVAAFRELLADLPDAQAESLALRVVLEYSLPDVAAATQAPVNTVRSRVRLALEELRRRIRHDPALRDMFDVELAAHGNRSGQRGTP
jgi:RNA polymerase sigma-70 factor (ECF subfamily)